MNWLCVYELVCYTHWSSGHKHKLNRSNSSSIHFNEVCCSHIFKLYKVVCRAAVAAAKPTHLNAHTRARIHIRNICLKIPPACYKLRLTFARIYWSLNVCAHAIKCVCVCMLPAIPSVWESLVFFLDILSVLRAVRCFFFFSFLFAFFFSFKKAFFHLAYSLMFCVQSNSHISMNVLF